MKPAEHLERLREPDQEPAYAVGDRVRSRNHGRGEVVHVESLSYGLRAYGVKLDSGPILLAFWKELEADK